MTVAERQLLERITRRAAVARPDVANRLIAAYQVIRDSLTQAELVRAINSGTVEGLITELLADEVLDPAFRPLRNLIDLLVVNAGGQMTLDLFPRASVVFDRMDNTVINAARTLDGRVIATLKADVRTAVRQHIADGIASGRGPRAFARGIRDAVGLSARQEQYVRNFRAQLLAGDRSALNRALRRGILRLPDGSTIQRSGHAGGRGLGKRDLALLERSLGTDPLTAKQVERMTGAYRNRLVAWNAESVSRSVTLEAQKLGQQLAWEQAIRDGIVDPARLRRTWIAVGGPIGDGRNRFAHLVMHGQTVKWGENYSTGQRVPGQGEYNCRCIERITMVQAVATDPVLVAA